MRLASLPLLVLAPFVALLAACSNSIVVSPCGEGEVSCDDGCTNVQSDPANCGACGEACDAGLACIEGTCSQSNCGPGLIECTSGCVNPNTDNANCGQCDAICPEGTACNGGTCSQSNCGPGLIECNSGCVNPNTDNANCGGCDVFCVGGTTCNNGFCAPICSDGLSECSGACVDLASDPSNCGDCGLLCPDGTVCNNGLCALACSNGLTECFGFCIDLATDPSNCGDCGIEGDYPTPGCAMGQCQAGCDNALAPCDGACVDALTSEMNCGGCGITCPADWACTNGACEPLSCDSPVCGTLCNVTELGMSSGFIVTGTTVGADNQLTAECTPSSAGEAIFRMTAAVPGWWSFSTAGSTFNTSLAMYTYDCSHMACNDDAPGLGFASRIELPLGVGQTLFLMVDGYATGDFVLQGVPVDGCDDGTLCAMECVDPFTSIEHCGGCFNQCEGGETCSNGVCGAN